MKLRNIALMVLVLLPILAIGVYHGYFVASSEAEEKAAKLAEQYDSAASEVSFEGETGTGNISDNSKLYEEDDPYDVTTMYLTVSRGTDSEGTNHSWASINKYSAYDYDYMGVEKYKVAAILQVGNEKGPEKGEFGYDAETPNATVSIRGQSSTEYALKNYKITIKDGQGDWNGQTVINLNKHNGEGLRFRNKLCYDLMSGIDEMMALRTQFVHLYVKDNTGKSTGSFKDYGLYTQVEQLNKTALEKRDLDKNGQLYKVNFFEFYRYDDVIKLKDDPDYDVSKFEDYLEIKGNDDHSKLIAMLEDVNDYSQSIDDILDEHFNRQNLTYWMAFQILVGNVDTQNRNFFIYSPQNSETWYFYSWDNDDAFMYDENSLRDRIEYGGWVEGVSNYWGNVLFQRCLKSDSFRKELDDAIQDIRSYITQDRLEEMVKNYTKTVKPYVYSMPDKQYAPLTSDQYDDVASSLPKLVEQHYEDYQKSLESPMPFYIWELEYSNGNAHLSWDASYDFDGEDLTYNAYIATDFNFKNVISEYHGKWCEMDDKVTLKPGDYFVKVTVTNESGYTQDAFDYYVDGNKALYGIKEFHVDTDGSVYEVETAKEG